VISGVEIANTVPIFRFIVFALYCNAEAFMVMVCEGSRLGAIGTMVEIDKVYVVRLIILDI
jgi:hypothetical protein